MFAAVPAVLLALTGWPDPVRLAHVRSVSASTALEVLAAVAWVAWVGCCGPLLASVVRRVRRRDVSTRPGAHIPEWVASRIAAAVLALSPVALTTTAGAVGAVRSAPAPTASSVSTHRAAASTADPIGAGPAGASAAAAADPGPPASAGLTVGVAEPAVPTWYTVADGDSLWSIAQHFYDDGSEWPTIAEANLGQVMDDGTRFMDPSFIRPGWVLVLPPVSTGTPPAASTSPAGPAPSATQPSATQPSATQPTGQATSPTSVPSSPAATVAAVAPAAATAMPTGALATALRRWLPAGPLSGTTGDVHGAGSPTGGVRRTTAAGGPKATRHSTSGRPAQAASGRQARSASGRRPPTGPSTPEPMPLPELVALGTGAVVAAALARRARRARHRAALVRPEGGRSMDPSEPAVMAATELVPFDRVPALQWLEAANRHLTAALEASGRAHDAPAARLVRVGSDGVEVRLAEPASWAPPGWVSTDGPSWVLPATTDLEAVVQVGRHRDPWLPTLLPVGSNDDGSWLVVAGPGSCLPVLGSGATALMAAMEMALESWAWADQLVVADRAGAVEEGTTTIVFFGDPSELSERARRRCSVVTALPLPATDLTVTVDAGAASLHPLGVVVRPDLLDTHRRAALAETLDVGRVVPRSATVRGSAASPVTVAVGPSEEPLAGLGPGSVDVRLLTAVPRLDGQAEELTPKRSRRAVELVAYLTLHHPVPVTGDRLRTRVLGSADADAAAKTLFNTAGAARRALGRDGEGEPLLPTATKGSHYRISPLVTSDVTRVAALVEAAGHTDVPDEAMALLREALSLVEDEPLARTTGYAWWQAEGHEQRVAGTLVDAACRLAPLASANGLDELARWAVEKARLVEPYSEALCRVAMRAAADAGDADRLRREWQECLRRVDDLDPGGLPSAATEQLYAELCRRVPPTTDGMATDGMATDGVTDSALSG